ncbi:hypothetical protein SOASR030_01720 [Leminorella grimontii]|uniref:Single-stranded DNA-binding protein n=1 Tax=Leminorella grimontii TaxID=82981 RepID=A0AAV5MW38_9GAMM|nr:hypothetical protein [Leminorella grimontii]KFC95373.1 nucleic acid-binding protein [Leminorella grimontii ATCC 33999 = DSM 5078]GKX54060.1 hypothetical protein SOASR030_01720 [Leminorella grimontii]VFS60172.1 Uncharacterised protein [Leminorella grimontii]
MAHSITIKLQHPAREFTAGESIGFGIRGGVRYYDRKSQENKYTNYQAVVFAKEGNQADYYRAVLTAGAIVEVFGDNIKINTFEGKSGQLVTLELLNARLGFIEKSTNESAQNKTQQEPPSKYASENIPPMDFDDDIPF